jgi:ABC-2 type transport system permease protein
MTSVASSETRPHATTTLLALHRLLVRTQVSVARLLGISALGALSLLLGALARTDDDPTRAAGDVVASYGLGLLVPLATLWLGTSVIGDLVEDRVLVYLWLKPVARWQLPAAAILATFTVVAPLTALPLAGSALVAGAGDVALPAFGAAVLAALAYTGIFVAAGLWFRRAVWWGLGFVLIWENIVALNVDGAARFTVTEWARSILNTAPGVDVSLGTRSAGLAFVVLPAVAVAGAVLATIRYRRADVD